MVSSFLVSLVSLVMILFLHMYSGLRKLQARKLVDCARQHGRFVVIPPISEYETANTSFTSLGSDAFSVFSNTERQHAITVCYLLCRDMFIKCIQSQEITGLDPSQKLLHLYQRIKGQEGITDSMEIELFSHEGYPLNADAWSQQRKSASELVPWQRFCDYELYIAGIYSTECFRTF